MLITTGQIWADNVKIFAPETRPVLVAPTQGEWSARWWQWALTSNGPVDLTGANCQAGQSGLVFFLAGATTTQPVTRSCTVSRDKILFFPILTVECSNVELPPFSGCRPELRSFLYRTDSLS
jgi:hypothetical protein